MTVLGLGLGFLFFSLTTNYFIKGLDTVLRATMLELTDEFNASEGQPKEFLGFVITKRWQDMPDSIKEKLEHPPSRPLHFIKHVVHESLFERPSTAYFAMLVEDKNGNLEYIAKIITPNQPARLSLRPEKDILWILSLGVGIAVIFVLIMILMIRSITAPVESLILWTKSLNRENLRKSSPDFRYHELNVFADILLSSLQKSQTSLDREHTFLKHASHELRTPIAVIGSNVELLQRLNENASKKEKEIVRRVERAGLTMKNLTETLLWLSRDNEETLPTKDIQIDLLIKQLTNDLNYLLKGKQCIEVIIATQPCTLILPIEVSRIVLSNLIRNAFQHTQSGKIEIRQSGSHVQIINSCQNEQESGQEELGFGLGLYLCQKLIRRFAWEFDVEDVENKHVVNVVFSETT